MDERKTIFEKENAFGKVVLWQHSIEGKKEYELVVNGVFIMASYNALSSERLIKNAVEKQNIRNGRLLIGGLGLGYSVREALRHRDQVGKITVVEINAGVIECNRTVLNRLNGKYLFDSRVEVLNEDFIKYIDSCKEKYDTICMDIDNGPMLIVNENNKHAYAIPFFKKVTTVLKKDGIFVIWSCNRDDKMLLDMNTVFSKCLVEEVQERHQGRDVPYYLYFGLV